MYIRINSTHCVCMCVNRDYGMPEKKERENWYITSGK